MFSKEKNDFQHGKNKIQNKFQHGHNNFQKQNGFQRNVQNHGQRSYAQNRKAFQQDSCFGYQNRYHNHFHKHSQKLSPTRHFLKMKIDGRKNGAFKPKNTNFPNRDSKKR